MSEEFLKERREKRLWGMQTKSINFGLLNMFNIFSGLLLIVPSFVIVGLCNNISQLYLGLGLYAVSTAFVVPCLTTLVSQYGETHQKGIVTGVFRSLGALGRAAGPIFGSFLYWSLGPELSYCLGGFGLLVPYFMLRSMNQ